MRARHSKPSLFKHSKTAFVAVGVFSLFINLLMLTGPLFMLQIYDSVLASGSVPTLVVLSILVAGLYLVLGFLELIRSRLLVRIGHNLDHHNCDPVFTSVLHHSLDPENGSRFSSALRELTTLRQFVSGPGPSTLFDAPWAPLYLAIIFAFHWTMGVLAITGAIVLFIIALLAERLVRSPMSTASGADAKALNHSEAGIRNAEVLSAMGMHLRFAKLWRGFHGKALIFHAKTNDRSGTLTATSKSLRLFLQSAMLALGAWLAIQQSISAGTMIAASIILGRALQPVEQAIGQWRSFVQARQAYSRIVTLLANTPDVENHMALPAPSGPLLASGIQIAIPGKRGLIVEHAEFDVLPGEVLVVIGPSASGKSTLARALVGVWPLVGGEIRLDGSTLDQWNREVIGDHIGYLPQNVELFEGTIARNISRFHEDPDEEEIIEAAKMAGIHHMVLGFSHGYDTVLERDGTNLSAGQRQRIALARAIYKKPALIVLDEPNSNLDNQGDTDLVETLTKLRETNCIVVVIAHRLSVMEAADKVLVLENGRQKAFGPRDQIFARQLEAPLDKLEHLNREFSEKSVRRSRA
ncbi:MAG: type I secretion system permease/ATPase [Cohaesibacteraceae bacterium]|nr:type I secretion system permease/ATPase [Cohaesibacteraceae bacterium]